MHTNVQWILHKLLITSVNSYVSTAREFASDTSPLKLEFLQDHVFLMTSNVSWCTMTHDPHEASQIPNNYGYGTLSCKQQAEAHAIIRMKIFATLDKAQHGTRRIRACNMAVMRATVQVTLATVTAKVGQDKTWNSVQELEWLRSCVFCVIRKFLFHCKYWKILQIHAQTRK